jgi:hypothetical protein
MIPIYMAVVGTLSFTLTVVGVTVGVLSYRRGGRQEPKARVKATINRKFYGDGWRSVQLHIGPSESNDKLQYQNWRIERAELVSPRDAVLARAENDDCATSIFYPDKPTRRLEGKAEGRPQRFALEFFIRFEGGERGRKAKFKVAFARTDGASRRTVTVAATVPNDAESSPPLAA